MSLPYEFYTHQRSGIADGAEQYQPTECTECKKLLTEMDKQHTAHVGFCTSCCSRLIGNARPNFDLLKGEDSWQN